MSRRTHPFIERTKLPDGQATQKLARMHPVERAMVELPDIRQRSVHAPG